MPFLGRTASHFKLSGSISPLYGHKTKQEIELSLCCDHMQQKSLLFSEWLNFQDSCSLVQSLFGKLWKRREHLVQSG